MIDLVFSPSQRFDKPFLFRKSKTHSKYKRGGGGSRNVAVPRQYHIKERFDDDMDGRIYKATGVSGLRKKLLRSTQTQ